MNPATLESLSPETLALLRQHNLLMPLVKSEVIKAAVGDIPVSREETAGLLEQYCRQRGLQAGEELENHLSSAGLTHTDLAWQISLEKKVVLHCQQKYLNKAEARFLEKKEQLDQVVYSLLRVRDGLLARELYLRIAEHEVDFSEAACEYSEGQERNTKGIIGPVPLTQAHPILAERLRTIKTGELVEPYSVEGWWLVVRLERYAPARFNEETAEKMARELFQEWVNEQSEVKIRALTIAEG